MLAHSFLKKKNSDASGRDPLVTVNEHNPVSMAASIMAGGVHRTPVVGDNDRILYTFSQSDVIRLLRFIAVHSFSSSSSSSLFFLTSLLFLPVFCFRFTLALPLLPAFLYQLQRTPAYGQASSPGRNDPGPARPGWTGCGVCHPGAAHPCCHGALA